MDGKTEKWGKTVECSRFAKGRGSTRFGQGLGRLDQGSWSREKFPGPDLELEAKIRVGTGSLLGRMPQIQKNHQPISVPGADLKLLEQYPESSPWLTS